MATNVRASRAAFRSVSVRPPMRATLQTVNYTRWQFMPAPAWCAADENQERCDNLGERFKDMSVDLFQDSEQSSKTDDDAAYLPHKSSANFDCEEIGAKVVFNYQGGSHPADSGADCRVTIKDNGSSVPVFVDGEELKKGEERAINTGAIVRFNDVPFQVQRDVRAHA